MNLATNDVTSFIEKQTQLKKASAKPDLKVKRAAMMSKMVDALALAKRLRQERDLLKRRLDRKYSSRKAQGRKICSEIVSQYYREKDCEFQEAREKIDHLKWKDSSDKEIKLAPDATREFLSHVNVFESDQLSMKPSDPEYPFMCSKDIKLDENELKLLARGPNFLVCDELDLETFEIEVEKAIVKDKYNRRFNSKDDCSDEDLSSETNVRGIRAAQLSDSSEVNSNSNRLKSENDIKSKVNELWEESSGSMVYNLKDKTLDLGNLKATNYKYNKTVGLPDPDSPEIETLHEFRRTEFRRIFDRAIRHSKASTTNASNRGVAKNGRGFSTNVKTKVVNPESNQRRSC